MKKNNTYLHHISRPTSICQCRCSCECW